MPIGELEARQHEDQQKGHSPYTWPSSPTTLSLLLGRQAGLKTVRSTGSSEIDNGIWCEHEENAFSSTWFEILGSVILQDITHYQHVLAVREWLLMVFKHFFGWRNPNSTRDPLPPYFNGKSHEKFSLFCNFSLLFFLPSRRSAMSFIDPLKSLWGRILLTRICFLKNTKAIWAHYINLVVILNLIASAFLVLLLSCMPSMIENVLAGNISSLASSYKQCAAVKANLLPIWWEENTYDNSLQVVALNSCHLWRWHDIQRAALSAFAILFRCASIS